MHQKPHQWALTCNCSTSFDSQQKKAGKQSVPLEQKYLFSHSPKLKGTSIFLFFKEMNTKSENKPSGHRIAKISIENASFLTFH